MSALHTRRDLMASLMAAGMLGGTPAHADDEPPEITRLRLRRAPTICVAPEQIAESALRAEGFTDVSYIEHASIDGLARGQIDFDLQTAAWAVANLDAGEPIVALAGVHVGCYELFAHEPVRAISDLKGRRVGIPQQPGSSGHLLLAVIAAHVGLDPRADIDWINRPDGDFLEAFARGEVDAFLGFPPEPQQLRARKIGHVILNTGMDKPWAQYFCCTALGNREFVRAHPIAAKRYLRAVLKSADICAAEPERAARALVDAGFRGRYEHALQALREVRYDRWRDYDPEDTLRFYALRLHDVGMIRSSPKELIAAGTDWHFFAELKRELKT
ncbi:ABC transporter substrate-binding protein [Benzoatithermus flavus]|uniref:ABC transporter substrate-binding protein n=1 Tax=Benzoatithermus flavus TaxID=3108223 RepID=A0ABU8XSU0_9PROT